MQSIFLQVTPGEENYVKALKPILAGRCKVAVNNSSPVGYYEVLLKAKERNCTAIATTSSRVLQYLLGGTGEKLPSTDSYAGSILDRGGFEWLILPPVEQLFTINYGRHIYERYLDKLILPERWLVTPAFTWEVFNPSTFGDLLREANNSSFIAVDIETLVDDPNRSITCCGFSFVSIDITSKQYTVRTVVVPFNDGYNVIAARRLLDTDAPKVLQNGKYDIAYLLRYNCSVRNYLFDTINLFHSWYSELPKDLGFIGGYLLRKWVYHKNENSYSDMMQHYEYNAKDCFSTAVALLTLLTELPPYAWQNYMMEFPLVYPCILSEHTGIKCDLKEMAVVRKKLEADFASHLSKLQKMVANPFYNPGSPKQTQTLFTILGSGDIKGTGKIERDKVSARHPLNKRILSGIASYREVQKLGSSYTAEEKIWNGRIYYSLNPHGTDTGRLASKESQFWCGFQIQNIPRDSSIAKIKSFYIADDGFYLGEADGEQAEARGTAYLSGDTALIEAVEGDRDYHSVNASDFFGVPYDDIVDEFGKVINKQLRDLAKRTNHGANYNMGPGVMVDTMGIENVLRAKKLLKLPESWSLLKVCDFLLTAFSTKYKTVKGPWYDKVKADVAGTKMLVSPTGWTRYCFGNPAKSKRDLNSYVAHPPQNLNAMVLNQAYLRVFKEIWLPNQKDFKLHAQIHDSILFSYREDREDLAWKVKELMEITVRIKDTFGISRNLLVPVALNGKGKRWSELVALKQKE
jgi:DNA polymerase I-like protein with 3'-5' exonuclease and polymerase domains